MHSPVRTPARLVADLEAAETLAIEFAPINRAADIALGYQLDRDVRRDNIGAVEEAIVEADAAARFYRGSADERALESPDELEAIEHYGTLREAARANVRAALVAGRL